MFGVSQACEPPQLPYEEHHNPAVITKSISPRGFGSVDGA